MRFDATLVLDAELETVATESRRAASNEYDEPSVALKPTVRIGDDEKGIPPKPPPPLPPPWPLAEPPSIDDCCCSCGGTGEMTLRPRGVRDPRRG